MTRKNDGIRYTITTMRTNDQEALAQAAEKIARAWRVVCLTGAGVSAESGLATFRGADGLWEGERPEDVATPQAFARDPVKVWRFYHARRRNLRTVQPNPGHFALARLETLLPTFTLITQNVDGLHWVAGSKNVIELHGDLRLDLCKDCPWRKQRELSEFVDEMPTLPQCPECGGLLRPGVVWFGEMLPAAALMAAQNAAQNCQVMLVVGTSSLVQPAASLAWWAKEQGASIIEINTENTELSPHADLCIRSPSGQVLPSIVEAVATLRGV